MDRDTIENIRDSKIFQRREQASVTVGRDSNEDFMKFKSTFLDNIESLKKLLFSAFISPTIDTDELYDMADATFSNLQRKMDTVLYLNAIYSSDYYIIEHCLRVGILANIFSSWLEIDEDTMKNATVAGFLHDIGMIQVPKQIIIKEGELTPEEFKAIQEHTASGTFMLMDKGIDPEILNAIRFHHERYDGSGYPKGKKGDETGYLSALVSIVDVYDSMTSNRPYSLAKCPFDVIDFLEKEMIDKFNPELLYVFLENIPYMYKDVLVKLSDGETAKVVFINKKHKTSPIVQLEKDGRLIDLSKHSDLKILSLL